MFIDSHSHTKHFSADAFMTINDLLNSCISSNVSTIAITEHYDLDYPHEDEPPMFCNLEDYVDSFSKWKEMSKSLYGPKLLMGIEFGYQSHLTTILDETSNKYDFDSVILSNHLYDGLDVWFNESCYSIPKTIRNSNYLNVMVEMADKINNYNIIGHFDYINRYNPRKDEMMLYSDSPESFDNLFEVIIAKEKSLEINTSSIEKRIRNNANDIMPDPSIIKRYIEMGGKMITLGSDAHKPEVIAINFKSTIEYLKSLGVKELCYFEKRKPVFYSI